MEVDNGKSQLLVHPQQNSTFCRQVRAEKRVTSEFGQICTRRIREFGIESLHFSTMLINTWLRL